MKQILTTFLLAALALATPGAQTPAGLIVGQVIDAATNKPVPNVLVALSGEPPANPQAVAAGLARPPVSSRQITDTSGRFAFRDLPGGNYHFLATAPGYMDGQFGQRRPNGLPQPFVLKNDERAGNVTIKLWKEASIGGTVTDESGEPVVSVNVFALRRENTGGTARVITASQTRTDDRGIYRFTRLLPGEYKVVVPGALSNLPASVVSAYQQAAMSPEGMREFSATFGASRIPMPGPGAQLGNTILQVVSASAGPPPLIGPDGKVRAYPTTFHPNHSTLQRAATVTLEAGERRTGIDVQLQETTMTTVTGTITGPNGPEPHFGVRLAFLDPEGGLLGGSWVDAALTSTDASGAFTFVGVAPGQYLLKAARVPDTRMAMNPFSTVTTGGVTTAFVTETPGGNPRPPLPPNPTLWANMPIAVGDEPVTGLNIQLRAGARLSGRLVFEGRAAQPQGNALQNYNVNLSAADTGPLSVCCPSMRVAPDGTFETQGYAPGKYLVTGGNSGPWSIRSFTTRGVDVIRSGLSIENEPITDIVITLTDSGGELTGIVHDSAGKPDAAASVVLFPAEFQTTMKDGMNARVYRLVRPSAQTGAFRMATLIPGEYFVVAASDDALENWQDAATMSKLAAVATRVTIGAAEKKIQDLTTRVIR